VLRTLATAALTALLIAIVSLNQNPEQIAFNRGAICLTAIITTAYLLICLFLSRLTHPGTAKILFVRFGGIALLLLSLLAYFVISSIRMERIL
jgi:FtsH-binding integral membrane protein